MGFRTRSYTSEPYGLVGLKSSYQNDENSRGSNAVCEPKNKLGTHTPLIVPQKYYGCGGSSFQNSPLNVRKIHDI